MIDEFQDTSPAQYRLVRFLASDSFKNVFAVADDDQIIYQWAGASYQQIASFREHFRPELFQLVENRRCPPEIVTAANNLVAHNAIRTPNKAPLISTKPSQGPAISLRVYQSEEEEAAEVAREIAQAGASSWGNTAVLARTRAILGPTLQALRSAGVKAAILTRRDRFVSPQFLWLQACLDQCIRPTDRRVFFALAATANKISGIELDPMLLEAEAEAAGKSLMEHWALAAQATKQPIACQLAEYAMRLVQSRSSWKAVVKEALTWLPNTTSTAVDQNDGMLSDADEDKAAWETATRAIRAERGGEPELAEFLQGIALRPKDPPADPNSVALLTVHGAKGLEFDFVWVIGMAESVLPSWQSLKSDAPPSEMEEERRNCFVAITRARKTLVLTRAKKYRGWAKDASRFLTEMGLLGK